jgi:hypothetical protein
MAGMTEHAPFGSWPSPITAELIVAAAVGLGGPAFAGGDLWWSELRPTEAGRVQLVRKRLDAAADAPGAEVLPAGFSARTRVHEYGGGAWWLHATDDGDDPGGDVTAFFANWADQRLYRIDHAGSADATRRCHHPGPRRRGRSARVPLRRRGRVARRRLDRACEWHGRPGH